MLYMNNDPKRLQNHFHGTFTFQNRKINCIKIVLLELKRPLYKERPINKIKCILENPDLYLLNFIKIINVRPYIGS
jgi:hypothetical protein